MVRELERRETEALLYGSLILGGGGGGGLEGGQYIIDQAYAIGIPTIVEITDIIEQGESMVITTSAVGAPAASQQYVVAQNYNDVVLTLKDRLSVPLVALITNEIGAGSSFNAFIQSAATGIPMLDAACNGRAHPLGTQGSMGLATKEDYITTQVAIGGNPETGKFVDMTVQGTVNTTSRLVRTAADVAGGLVVVARNPIELKYVAKHAAIGALTRTIALGNAYLSADAHPESKIQAVVDHLAGEVFVTGSIVNYVLETVGGLDKGYIEVEAFDGMYRMYFCNEYMALEKDGTRLSTFPDLLMTFATNTALPLTSAELTEGQVITIISVPKEHLLLGAGMFERSGYEAVEDLIGVPLVSYNEEILKD